ncbi:LysE family translocator [Rhodococcus fascians]|uniref:LysE family translocator n=1 Tax=Nocardiaceae TaxID=85025 RepID=UPI000428B6ED|nr:MULTISPECIES: LysE family translocator [Rhodococcus]OZD34854.1 LysE family translocator [Rhodococcus sp. 06-1477-1B]MBJ7324351.1 LysE family translocator [Rhodococcus sp. (in: high G+C Gram-positive bacteria)]MBM7243490.1 LysE family translocator [Rhodococcus fascians]MBW4778459.1 LysE family translocator [Rhodococcus fascians]MBX5329991.1 LysE family translocator [Rhodococcus fascians]
MTLSLLLSFAGVCFLLAILPGPDSFLVLRYSIGGLKPGVAAAMGVAIGGLFWAVLVAVGLAAIVEQSATAYRVVKVLGGLYLLYLGVKAFRARRKNKVAGEPLVPVAASAWSAFGAGVLSCALNPKVGLFYLAVVPQFLTVVTFTGAMTLGLVEVVVAAVVMGVFSVLASRAVTLLRKPAVTDWLDRISAGFLVALGIGTVASSA